MHPFRTSPSIDDFDPRRSLSVSRHVRTTRHCSHRLSDEWLAAGYRNRRAGDTFSADEWRRLFQLYASTYAMRGQQPYLTLSCLQAWAAQFGERLQFCIATRDRKSVV